MLNIYRRPTRLSPVMVQPGRSPTYRKVFRKPFIQPSVYSPDQLKKKPRKMPKSKVDDDDDDNDDEEEGDNAEVEEKNNTDVEENAGNKQTEKYKLAKKKRNNIKRPLIPPLKLNSNLRTGRAYGKVSTDSVSQHASKESNKFHSGSSKRIEPSLKPATELDQDTTETEVDSEDVDDNRLKAEEVTEEAFAKEYTYGRRRTKVFEEMNKDEKYNFYKSEYRMNSDQIQELTFRPKVNKSKLIHQTYTKMDVRDWRKSNRNLKPEVVDKPNTTPRASIISVTPSHQRKEFMLSQLQGTVYHDINDIYGYTPRDERQKRFFDKLAKIQAVEEKLQLELQQNKEQKRLDSTIKQRKQLKRLRQKYEMDAWRRFMTQYVTSKVMEYEQSDRKVYGLPNFIDTDLNKKQPLRTKTPSKDKANKEKYNTLFNCTPRPEWKVEGPLKFEGYDSVVLDTDTGSGESGRERLVVSQLIKDASRLLKDVEYADSDRTSTFSPIRKGLNHEQSLINHGDRKRKKKRRKRRSKDTRQTQSDRTSPFEPKTSLKDEGSLRQASCPPIVKIKDTPRDVVSTQSLQNDFNNKILRTNDDQTFQNNHKEPCHMRESIAKMGKSRFTDESRRPTMSKGNHENVSELEKTADNRLHSSSKSLLNDTRTIPLVSEQKRNVHESESDEDQGQFECLTNIDKKTDIRENTRAFDTVINKPGIKDTKGLQSKVQSSKGRLKSAIDSDSESKKHLVGAHLNDTEKQRSSQGGSKIITKNTRNQITVSDTHDHYNKKGASNFGANKQPQDPSKTNLSPNKNSGEQLNSKLTKQFVNTPTSKPGNDEIFTETNKTFFGPKIAVATSENKNSRVNSQFDESSHLNETVSPSQNTTDMSANDNSIVSRKINETENETVVTSVQNKKGKAKQNKLDRQNEPVSRNISTKISSNIPQTSTSHVNNSSWVQGSVSETDNTEIETDTSEERTQKVQWKDLVEKYLYKPPPAYVTNDESDDDDESLADIFERAIRRHALKLDEDDDDDDDESDND